MPVQDGGIPIALDHIFTTCLQSHHSDFSFASALLRCALKILQEINGINKMSFPEQCGI
jgi:hypothetical protein